MLAGLIRRAGVGKECVRNDEARLIIVLRGKHFIERVSNLNRIHTSEVSSPGIASSSEPGPKDEDLVMTVLDRVGIEDCGADILN